MEDWVESRRWSVTASDIAAILKVDKYTTTQGLYRDKFSGDPLDDGTNPRLHELLTMGRFFEDTALDTFLTATRYAAERAEGTSDCFKFGAAYPPRIGFAPGLHAHRDYPWLRGTPDFVLPSTRKTPANTVLEIKTHWHPGTLQAVPLLHKLDIPLKYYLQVQTYLSIVNTSDGLLFSFTVHNGWTLFSIKRDQNLFDVHIVPAALVFYNNLQAYKTALQCFQSGTASAEHLDAVKARILDNCRTKRGEKQTMDALVRGSLEAHVTLLERGEPISGPFRP